MPLNNVPNLFVNGPFTLPKSGPVDIYSLYVNDGNPLTQWIPTVEGKRLEEDMTYLTHIRPKGYQGDVTFEEYLRSLPITECGGGPTTEAFGFSFHVEGAELRVETETLRLIDTYLRNPHHETTTISRIRGLDLPVPELRNDGDWATARAVLMLQSLIERSLVTGNKDNSPFEFDGLEKVIAPSYISQHSTFNAGTSIDHLLDPMVVDFSAVDIADYPQVGQLLLAISKMVRVIVQRASRGNLMLSSFNDMAIVMPSAMWRIIAEAAASGALTRLKDGNFGFVGQISIRDYEERFNSILTSYVLPIDNMMIPVLPVDELGMTVDYTANDSNNNPVTQLGITGDIYVLTRRLGGINLLEQRYINWNNVGISDANARKNVSVLLNGLARRVFNTSTDGAECFYYTLTAGGMFFSRSNYYQGRINNVTLPLEDRRLNEHMSFWGRNFYANKDNATSGLGVAVLP